MKKEVKSNPIPIRIDMKNLVRVQKLAKKLKLPLATTIRFIINGYFELDEK